MASHRKHHQLRAKYAFACQPTACLSQLAKAHYSAHHVQLYVGSCDRARLDDINPVRKQCWMTTCFPLHTTHGHKAIALTPPPSGCATRRAHWSRCLAGSSNYCHRPGRSSLDKRLPAERAGVVRARLHPFREAAGTSIESVAAFRNHPLRSLDDVHAEEASVVRHHVVTGVPFQIELGNCLRKLAL